MQENIKQTIKQISSYKYISIGTANMATNKGAQLIQNVSFIA